MIKLDGDNIYCTRGDSGTINVQATNDDGTQYTFTTGTTVRFNVVKENDTATRIFAKEVTLDEDATQVSIPITSTETTIGDYINKKVTYWYEVEINPEANGYTIIGYDKNGPKKFILLPEGARDE
jgi:hypothetical protein